MLEELLVGVLRLGVCGWKREASLYFRVGRREERQGIVDGGGCLWWRRGWIGRGERDGREGG